MDGFNVNNDDLTELSVNSSEDVLPYVNSIFLASNRLGFALSPSYIGFSSESGTISLISSRNGRLLKLFYCDGSKIENMYISDNEKYLFYSIGKMVFQIDIDLSLLVKKLKLADRVGYIGELDGHFYVGVLEEGVEFFSSNNFNLLNIDTNECVYFYNGRENLERIIPGGNSKYFGCVSFRRDKKKLIRRVSLWDLSLKKVIHTLECDVFHHGSDFCPSISCDFIAAFCKRPHEFLASASYDLSVYDMSGGNTITLELKLEKEAKSLDISHDSKYVVFLVKGAGYTNVVFLIDIQLKVFVGGWLVEFAQSVSFINGSYDFIVLGYNFIKRIAFRKISPKNISFQSYVENQDIFTSVENNDVVEKSISSIVSFSLIGKSPKISCAALSENSNLIAVCFEGTIRFFDTDSGKSLGALFVPDCNDCLSVYIDTIYFYNDCVDVLFTCFYEYKAKRVERLKLYFDGLSELFHAALFNGSKDNVSFVIRNNNIKIFRDDCEQLTVHVFVKDDYVSMRPDGAFVANDGAIRKYLLCKPFNTLPRKLTPQEILNFRIS